MKGACVTIVTIAYLSYAAGQNVCPDDGSSFSVENQCTKYYNCTTGSPVLTTCAVGLYYNCMNQVCETSPFTPCCYLDPSSPAPTYVCNSNVNVLQSNPAMCSNFYRCSGGSVLERTCNGGYFNNITHGCQGSPVVCNPTTTASPTTVSTTQSTTVTTTAPTTALTTASVTTTMTTARSTLQSISNQGVPTSTCGAEGTKIGNVINCNLYYECQNGAPVAVKCPWWQRYFNCWTKTCSYLPVSYCCNSGKQPFVSYTRSKNGMLVADPESCNNYYNCIGKKVVKQACTNGYVFDVWKNKCLSPMEAKCAISPNATACTANNIGLLPIGILSVSSSLLCPPLR